MNLFKMTKRDKIYLPAANEDATIPEQVAVEIRHLVHDLSNALEIIVQTSFLLNSAELKAPASEWLGMMDGGVQKAIHINLKLRDYIKQHAQQ
jgi:hypothetical protein